MSNGDQNSDYVPVYPPPNFATRMGNYARLAVSRNPAQLQRSFNQSSVEEGTHQPTAAPSRFQAGAWSVAEAVAIQRNAQLVGSSEGADRFAAAAELGMQVENHPHREAILKALQKKANKNYAGPLDRLLNELFLLGQKVFDIFTPSALNTHTPYFTAVFTLIICVVFFFMAAEYPRYQEEHDQTFDSHFGPRALVDWISKSNNVDYQFSVDYLWLWGGRAIPEMNGSVDTWRWLTSLLLHQNFQHIINNLILFVLFALPLEHKYGTCYPGACRRITLLTILAGLGGNFLSAAFEEICVMVIGASGCCFGLLGLFVADMALNFETITFPILRAIIIIVMVILNLHTVFTTESTSNLSHLGGFITGLFPSFIFLPNLKWERYEASFPYLGGITILFFFLFLPIFVYLVRFPDSSEGCL